MKRKRKEKQKKRTKGENEEFLLCTVKLQCFCRIEKVGTLYSHVVIVDPQPSPSSSKFQLTLSTPFFFLLLLLHHQRLKLWMIKHSNHRFHYLPLRTLGRPLAPPPPSSSVTGCRTRHSPLSVRWTVTKPLRHRQALPDRMEPPSFRRRGPLQT